MDESDISTSVAASKLLYKASELEKELLRLKSTEENLRQQASALQKAKDAAIYELNQAQNEIVAKEATLLQTRQDLESQTEVSTSDLASLKFQLDMKSAQLDALLSTRDSQITKLMTENHELHKELEKSKRQLSEIESESRCQKNLAKTLVLELKELKQRQSEVREELARQNSKLDELSESNRAPFEDREPLASKIRSQEECIKDLKQKLSSLFEEKRSLEKDCQTCRDSLEEHKRQKRNLELALKDSYASIKTEREHKNRILELLRCSEEANAQVNFNFCHLISAEFQVEDENRRNRRKISDLEGKIRPSESILKIQEPSTSKQRYSTSQISQKTGSPTRPKPTSI